MNPVKQIGRYQIPILSVMSIRPCSGPRAWARLACQFVAGFVLTMIYHERGLITAGLDPGYDVTMTNGHKFHFTTAEKAQLEKEWEFHNEVMQIYGMAKGLGLRG